MTCAWISAAPSKMLRMRASHSTRLIGYSSAKPLPPWICRALSAAAQATRARQQLGHAGFEIAAAACVLLAGGAIGELACRHDLGRHQRQLVGDAREGEIGLPNWLRSQGIARPRSSAFWATPMARAAVWMRAALEGLHQLLEALALDAAEQVFRLDRESRRSAISYSFMPR